MLTFDYSQVRKVKQEVNVRRYNRLLKAKRTREMLAEIQRATYPRLVKQASNATV